LHRGCYNCGFFVNTLLASAPTAGELLQQFRCCHEESEREVKRHAVPAYATVEFPCDGSFLNPTEVPSEAAFAVLRELALNARISRVMVESRPEFVHREYIARLLSNLRPDQALEVGIGLETVDPFISLVSIHKGYGAREFEQAVCSLAGFPPCRVLAYSIFKPAYVTETEAIDDALSMCRYVVQAGRRLGIDSVVKYEPATVARGTLLDVLYDRPGPDGGRAYSPPQYWSIAELVARLYEEGLANAMRIGAREDMDLLRAMPAIYHPNGMLSRFDFVLYDAVQQFNAHHSIDMFLADIEPALGDSSYQNWRAAVSLDGLALERLYADREAAIRGLRQNASFRARRRFLGALFRCLDDVEYGEVVQRFLRLQATSGAPDWLDAAAEMVREQLQGSLENVAVSLASVQALDDPLGLIQMELNLYSYATASYHSVWINIPSRDRVSLPAVEVEGPGWQA
jgi:radical SAM enzyme (TIGR01210 family)